MTGSTVTLTEASLEIKDLSISSDGNMLVTGSLDRSVRVYTSGGGNYAYSHSIVMPMDIYQVHLNNDKNQIFVGGQDNKFFTLENSGGIFSITSQTVLNTNL